MKTTEKIYENENGFVKRNALGDIEVIKKSARILDGFYDISLNHVFTIYENGYVREEYLGKIHNMGLKTQQEQVDYAIKCLK